MSIVTHKEYDDYASEYNHEFPLETVPCQTGEYRPTTHFTSERKRRRIGGDVIRGCIEEGQLFEAEDHNRYKFIWTHPTTLQTYVLIVELNRRAFFYDQAKHDCITVFRFQH
jgi:hypothetical protein